MYTRIVIGIILFLLSDIVHSQDSININRDNYYSFYLEHAPEGNSVTTSWLSKDEVLDYAFKLFEKNGCKFVKYTLYKYEEQIILLHGFDGYKKIGFYFQSGHWADPISESRTDKNVQFSYVVDNLGWADFELDSLPSNILILKENWYWYQSVYPDNIKNIQLVTKTDSFAILKEDILDFLNEK